MDRGHGFDTVLTFPESGRDERIVGGPRLHAEQTANYLEVVVDAMVDWELGGSSTGDNAIGHCAFLFGESWAGAGW